MKATFEDYAVRLFRIILKAPKATETSDNKGQLKKLVHGSNGKLCATKSDVIKLRILIWKDFMIMLHDNYLVRVCVCVHTSKKV